MLFSTIALQAAIKIVLKSSIKLITIAIELATKNNNYKK